MYVSFDRARSTKFLHLANMEALTASYHMNTRKYKNSENQDDRDKSKDGMGTLKEVETKIA